MTQTADRTGIDPTLAGLARYQPFWDQARAGDPTGKVFNDGSVLLATDFEGGNGTDIQRTSPGHYLVRPEPDPGDHRFSGKSYYFCFGVRNLQAEPRTIRVRLAASGWDYFGAQTQHVVIRRAGRWTELGPDALHQVDGEPDTADLDLPLPGTDEPDPVLFISNFHWYPYTEMVQWLQTLPPDRARVTQIARSYQGRPIYAVEIGRDEPDAPSMVLAQTPQPSEMGSLTCKALIDYLCTDTPEVAAIRDRFRICFIPMTNPDGTVLGLTVSDAQGHFPCFEGHLAATGDPAATPETVAVWRYLEQHQPLLFWEWHSNNWSRRPGHMLIRYRPHLIHDAERRTRWEKLDDLLLALPDTHHENWTSHTEGPYQSTMGFQAATRLGAISMMIKHHDKFPLERSQQHAIACLNAAAQALA